MYQHVFTPEGSWLTETEDGFMEPKYKKRFVSVMKHTPSSSTDKASQDPYRLVLF